MKERPILFSAPMVRAILDGRKTQTRRVVKPQPTNGWQLENPPVFGRITSHHPKRGRFGAFIRRGVGSDFPEIDLIPSPYGMPRNRLWVREAFQPLFADGVENHWETDWKTGKGYAISYPATDGIQEFVDADDNISSACKPSIHMPRWASRILLEITAVRVERLQDISEADAAAEGLFNDGDIPFNMPWFVEPQDSQGYSKATDCYAALWERINGAGSWDENPWVWVVEFKRLKGGAA